MSENISQSDPRRGRKPPFKEQEQPSPGLASKMEPQPDHGESSYRGLGRLENKVALVTGGDSGIGRAVGLAFAREGADVAFAYLNEGEDAEAARRLIEESGRTALAMAGDIGDEMHCKSLVERMVERFGRIDVLVNNAAFQGPAVSGVEELSAERVAHTFRTNILPMFTLVRLALPHMRAGGAIINVASIQAYEPSPGILDYASTKGAIVTFTKGLAKELAQRGIRVNAVAPGPVWTPLIAQSFSKETVAQLGANYPLQRPAQPVEVASSFVFLACDESRHVSGEILGVTGGKRLS